MTDRATWPDDLDECHRMLAQIQARCALLEQKHLFDLDSILPPGIAPGNPEASSADGSGFLQADASSGYAPILHNSAGHIIEVACGQFA
jgi:hypothetical protein